MIKLKLLLEAKYKYGCVMCLVDQDTTKKILNFNYSLIDDKHLYGAGSDKGRETTVHITAFYGLTKSYSENKMQEFLKGVKPFKVKINGLSIFENDDFDVVKLDVSSKELSALNNKFSKLPNENEFPDFKGHITLAYVKKGMGKKFITKKKKFSNITINTIDYSDKGEHSYFNL